MEEGSKRKNQFIISGWSVLYEQTEISKQGARCRWFMPRGNKDLIRAKRSWRFSLFSFLFSLFSVLGEWVGRRSSFLGQWVGGFMGIAMGGQSAFLLFLSSMVQGGV